MWRLSSRAISVMPSRRPGSWPLATSDSRKPWYPVSAGTPSMIMLYVVEARIWVAGDRSVRSASMAWGSSSTKSVR